jgi:hypothetical protein
MRCVWRAGEQLEPVLSRLCLLKASSKRWRFAWSTAWLLSTFAPPSSHRGTARGGRRAKLGMRAKLLRVQRQVRKRRSEQWLRWRKKESEEQAAARRRSPNHDHLVTSISGVRLGLRQQAAGSRQQQQRQALAGLVDHTSARGGGGGGKERRCIPVRRSDKSYLISNCVWL